MTSRLADDGVRMFRELNFPGVSMPCMSGCSSMPALDSACCCVASKGFRNSGGGRGDDNQDMGVTEGVTRCSLVA